VPEPGHWRLSGTLTGTPLHIEHIEDENVAVPYWHDQHLVVAELSATAVRGIAPNLALSVTAPLRYVRDRIRFRDLAGQPYVPPVPDQHHRNETLIRFGDVSVAMPVARTIASWTVAIAPGVAIPTGRTEANPFALGRLGLPHQHIQFGSGTFDPTLAISALGERAGLTWIAAGDARWTLYENTHGYRAGDRYGLGLQAGRAIAGPWNGRAGLAFAHERAERWDGRLEEEGNLGRTDLDLTLALGRPIAASGTWTARAQIPLVSRSTGVQTRYPVIFALSWSR
jgi:hypothetical protein